MPNRRAPLIDPGAPSAGRLKIGLVSIVVAVVAACGPAGSSPGASTGPVGVIVGNQPSAPTSSSTLVATPQPTPSPTAQPIVVTPAPTPTPLDFITTCAGDPATTTYKTDERIAIVFDGTVCSIVVGLSDDDDPNVALVLATVGGFAQWNGGSGGNWTRKGVGDGEEPGFYFVHLTRDATGDQYEMALEVAMTVLGSNNAEITVRDVMIKPEGIPWPE